MPTLSSLRTAAHAAAIAAVLIVVPALPARAQDFRIVVNSANPVTTLQRDELSRLLLKKVTTWKSGGAVHPVELRADAPARRAFSKAVHGRDVEAIRSYWQQQIFSGRATPPAERATDAEVLAFVRANPGAIGYVSADVPLGSGVKVLTLVD